MSEIFQQQLAIFTPTQTPKEALVKAQSIVSFDSLSLGNFGHKFETKTVTEEGTRETSWNKDSNLCLGSFEVIGYRDRMHFWDESQGLHTIKDKVVQTLNSYRSYWTSLQKEMMKLKIENQKLKDMLL